MEQRNSYFNLNDLDKIESKHSNLDKRFNKLTLLGLSPKVWIFISSSFTIFFNFIFSFVGIVSVKNFSLLSFYKVAYVWIWLFGFFASLLFGICLIFLTAYNKLNKESRNVLRFYEILILINIGSLLIAIVYDFYFFCAGLLSNYLLDGLLIFFSAVLILFDYIQWVSLKRQVDPVRGDFNIKSNTEILSEDKINVWFNNDTELKE